MTISREQALAWRVQAQQLTAPRTRDLTGPAVLDLGVQDTGTDGGGWALVNRGVDPAAAAEITRDLVLAWTLRGAPHLYRRSDVGAVEAATAPFSEADAAKRIFDAARPLRAAGNGILDALDVVAGHMRDIVTGPTVKGEMSSRLTALLPDPYLRECRSCRAIHTYEQPFRLSALRAGLELRRGTSPPVLEPIEGWTGPASTAPATHDVIRGYLRFLGPATPQHVAAYLDAPVKEVKAHWPKDAIEVVVGDLPRWVLADDHPGLESADVDPAAVRLLSPYDLHLQARDRELLVPDEARRKRLWAVLGRPGAILLGSEIVGTWRPRASGSSFTLRVDQWSAVPHEALSQQAELLAAYRGSRFAGFADADA